MIRLIHAAIALSFLGLSAAAPLAAEDAPEPATWLIVLQGEVMAMSDAEMILAADPRIVAFTDRPGRAVRLVDLAMITAAWREGGDFRADPPNASLFDEANNALAIIEISDLVRSGDQAVLTFVVLEGALPHVGDHIALTVDQLPGGGIL